MEEFTIKSGRVRGCQHDMAGFARTMRSQADDVDRIRRALRGKISSSERLGERLWSISSIMEEQAVHFDTMGEKADVIAGLYEQAERNILGEKEESPWNFGDLFSDVLGEAGIAGSTFSFGSSVVSWFNKDNWDDPMQIFLDTAGSMIDLESDVWGMEDPRSFKEAIGWTKYWDWDGLGDVSKLSKGDRFLSSLKHEAVDSVDFMKDSGWAKGLGIAGSVITVATTAYDNYKECKSGEISVGRAVAETVGEVAVDWGIGILATAAAAALLPVGAPAVAVGAAAAGVTWLADCICESFTGKGLTETISDAALDAGTAIWNAGTEAVSAIGDGLSDVGGTIADWWGALW